jgi:hypothetical protein
VSDWQRHKPDSEVANIFFKPSVEEGIGNQLAESWRIAIWKAWSFQQEMPSRLAGAHAALSHNNPPRRTASNSTGMGLGAHERAPTKLAGEFNRIFTIRSFIIS